MKGKTTFFGAKRRIRLWYDSSDDVWKWWLSFSTSFKTLLLYSTFPTLCSATDPVTAQTFINYMFILPVHCHFSYPLYVLLPGWNHLLGSLEALSGCSHLGNRVFSWICTFWMWFHRGHCTPVYVFFYAAQPFLQQLAVLSLWKFL